MKNTLVIVITFFFGSYAATQSSRSLTQEQVKSLAVRLANDQAAKEFHCRPFHDSLPARFKDGRWVWTDRCGVGQGDIFANVELAMNGETKHIDLLFMTNSPEYRVF